MGLLRYTPAQLLLTCSYTLRPDISGQLRSCYRTLALSRVSLPEHSSIGMVSDVLFYSSEAARIGLLRVGTDRSRAR